MFGSRRSVEGEAAEEQLHRAQANRIPISQLAPPRHPLAVETRPVPASQVLERRAGPLDLARRFDEALGEARVAVELAPDTAGSWSVAVTRVEEGKYDGAVAEFQKLADAGVNPAYVLGHLGNAYARAGRVREARECLRKLKERLKEGVTGTYEVALVYAGLGEKDQAFEWLDRAYEARDRGLLFLKVEPCLDPLRSDPRFQDLLRRMNFPS